MNTTPDFVSADSIANSRAMWRHYVEPLLDPEDGIEFDALSRDERYDYAASLVTDEPSMAEIRERGRREARLAALTERSYGHRGYDPYGPDTWAEQRGDR